MQNSGAWDSIPDQKKKKKGGNQHVLGDVGGVHVTRWQDSKKKDMKLATTNQIKNGLSGETTVTGKRG